MAPSMIFYSIFNLMGVINVSLIWWTRPAILLIGSDGTLGPNDPRFVPEDDIDTDLYACQVPHAPNGASNEGVLRDEEIELKEPNRQPRNRFGGENVVLPREV
jgi:hypothetical protein